MLRTRTGVPICEQSPLGSERWVSVAKKQEEDVHEVAERAEKKERPRAEDPKTKRPCTQKRLGKGDTPARSWSCLGSDHGHTAHAVDDRINFPMGTDAQHHSGCVPPSLERIV